MCNLSTPHRHFEEACDGEIHLHQKDTMDKKGYTYILASMKNGTLYVGVTSDLEKRIYEHKTGAFEGFTKKYNIHLLVWYQEFPTIIDAIEYEKIIKKWRREKKINLIEELNPGRNDLSKKR